MSLTHNRVSHVKKYIPNAVSYVEYLRLDSVYCNCTFVFLYTLSFNV